MFEHEIMTAGELLDKQLPSKPIVVWRKQQPTLGLG